jgi:heme O synthase-like polyprenyltransferase
MFGLLIIVMAAVAWAVFDGVDPMWLLGAAVAIAGPGWVACAVAEWRHGRRDPVMTRGRPARPVRRLGLSRLAACWVAAHLTPASHAARHRVPRPRSRPDLPPTPPTQQQRKTR